MSQFFNFDTSKFPVIVLTIQGSPGSTEEMDAFLEAWQNIYVISMEQNKQYKLIFDTRKAGSVELKYLKQMGLWLGKVKCLTEKWMDRTAIIVSTPIIKLLIQFVFQIYKAVRPFKVFSGEQVEEAFVWAISSEDEGDVNISLTDTSISLTDLKNKKRIDFS